MEANQVHPLLGPTILTLSRSSLPSKLQIINFIRFKTDSKRNSNQEKMEKYHEVAKDLISIWRGAYIIVSNAPIFILEYLDFNLYLNYVSISYSAGMKRTLCIKFKPKLFH